MPTNVPVVGSLVNYTSLTKELLVIPARYSIMADLGLFQAEFLNTQNFTLPKIDIKDFKADFIPWGTYQKSYGKDIKGYLTLDVPHVAITDAIVPSDTKNKYAWEDVIATDRKDSVVGLFNRKRATGRQAITNKWNEAMIQLVKDGTATRDAFGNTIDYYTEFGVTRTDVAFDLADDTVDPMVKIKEGIDDIQNNFRGGFVPTRFLCLASPTFFDKLERHAVIVDSYKYIAQTQSTEILNQRLGNGGVSGLTQQYQTLDIGGVTFVRLNASEMTANEARLFPLDVPDLFKIFFAPSEENFSTIDSTAEQLYYFEYLNDRMNEYSMIFESNFLPATMWPKAIVRLTTT